MVADAEFVSKLLSHGSSEDRDHDSGTSPMNFYDFINFKQNQLKSIFLINSVE